MEKRCKTGGIILAVLALMCLTGALCQKRGEVSPIERLEQQERESLREDKTAMDDEALHEERVEVYESRIDFEKLQKANSDIYGWLDIPGTNISYPLLQHKKDDSFYLDHNSDGLSDPAGALFTESRYNSTDFTDPAVVIYGHHMRSGVLFGNLQQFYTEEDAFGKYPELLVYLPDGEIHYRVFAAVPYDAWHLLAGVDFEDDTQYRGFLNSIKAVRSINARWLDEEAPETGEQLLILSTCLNGNSQKRYLVFGKRIEE